MDVNDVFWKLTRGVKFRKRCSRDNAPGLEYHLPSNSSALDCQHKEPVIDQSSGIPSPPSAPSQSVMSHESVSAEDLRRMNRIRVTGADVPRPIDEFAQLTVRYGVRDSLIQRARQLGYHEPTPVQQQVLPVMLERREVLACAPTGSGKTAAYLLPLIHQLSTAGSGGCRAVVVAPSRELARQIALEAERLAEGGQVNVHCLDRVQRKTMKPHAAWTRCQLLVTTPKRLIFVLDAEPAVLSLGGVEWLVVDESDKLFEDGASGFRHQLARIYGACESSQVRRALFSATFAQPVHDWCQLNLDSVISMSVGQKNAASDVVEQQLTFVGNESGKLYALRNIMQQGLVTPCLVFVQSKERAKELFRELIYDGVMVDAIHADRTQAQRDNVVRAFRSGKVWVLICTELMGRGIDFKGVNLVINYDMPPSTISYIHRVGRTGRAGRPGRSVTFFTHEDVPNMRPIAHLVKNSGCDVADYLLQAPKLNKKRRRYLAERPLKRRNIDTTPLYDLEKKARINALRKSQKRRMKEKSNSDNPDLSVKEQDDTVVDSNSSKEESKMSPRKGHTKKALSGNKKKAGFIRAFESQARRKNSSLKRSKQQTKRAKKVKS